MKKELKNLIKKLKLSDDQIMELINTSVDKEADVMNEADEPSASNGEKDQAESASATEKTKKNMTMKDLEKLIAKSVKDAINQKEPLLPSQKPLKKPEPNPKSDSDVGFKFGEFNLIQ